MELNEAIAIAIATLRGVVKYPPEDASSESVLVLTQAADVLENTMRKARVLDLIGEKAASAGLTKTQAEALANLVIDDDPSLSGVKAAAGVYEKRMVDAGLDPAAYAARLTESMDADDPKAAQTIFKEIRDKIAAHEKGGESE